MARTIQPMPPSHAPSTSVPIRDRLRSDLKSAMKTKDQMLMRVLRTAIAAIDNAEAVEGPTGAVGTIGYGDVPRRHLEPPKAVEILEAEIHERETGSAEYRRVGRADAAETLQAEISILRLYVESS